MTRTEQAKNLRKTGTLIFVFWGFAAIANLYVEGKSRESLSAIAPGAIFSDPVSFKNILLGSIPVFLAGAFVHFLGGKLKEEKGHIVELYDHVGRIRFLVSVWCCVAISVLLGLFLTFGTAS